MDLSWIRIDLIEAVITASEYQFPDLAARRSAAQPGNDGRSGP
jgi:hypothetical protein